MKSKNEIEKLGLIKSFSIYIPAAILMYLCTKYLIPYVSQYFNIEIILSWFLVGGLLIFLPLIILGIVILKNEGYKLSADIFTDRLRFRKITARDLMWSIIGLIIIGILSGGIMQGLKMILGDFDHSPAFMSFDPLSNGRYWLLLVWFPFWILNILGEEFLWRGVMLPRQEIAFGKYAWLNHGFGWLLFHIPFGWQLLITLIPIILILPFIVQKTENTWSGVIIHGGLNGPSFVAISFGLI